MKTKRFVIYWTLLVVTTLSIGIVAFLSLRREGETIRAHSEETFKVASVYHEMAKYSQKMADYAEERADYAMSARARTIVDNIDLFMIELKDGLMQSLKSFPEEDIAMELTRWKDRNNFVGEVYLWQGDKCLPFPGQLSGVQPSPKNLPLFNSNEVWVWNDVERTQTVSIDPFSKAVSPEQVPDDDLALSSRNKLKGKTEDSLDGPLPRTNSPQPNHSPNAPSLNYQANAPELTQLNEDQTRHKLSSQLQLAQRGIGEQLESLPKNKAWSSPSYLNDNYRKNQKARQELRDATQTDIISNIQRQQSSAGLKEQAEPESEKGWQYLNGPEGRLWGCWLSSKPTSTRGLQIDSKELAEKLQTALGEEVGEDERFVLLDEQGAEVCSLGASVAEGEEFSSEVLEIGDGLPGWTLLATRRKPPVISLPELKSLPANSLALSGEGWSGYVVISSIMAAILVGSTLLGGAVLLIQVRRNSLEAVRKTTFVSNVSHELKTPLTTIRMYGEMLGDGLVKDEEKRSNYLSTIIGESQRLTRLVNNVLDFSRLERGEKRYNLESLDLATSLKEILEAQRPRLAGEGLQVDWSAEDCPYSIEADRDALEQVLLNLLDNVVKYAADGERVGVKLSSDQGEIMFEVADHGPGIPAEQRESVFETFHRVDDSLTANQPGCGLGLGIARKLVEGMGGRISCGRNKPNGAVFRVTFPKS